MVKSKHIGKYIVGAYATSPNLSIWNENLEFIYFQLLKKIPQIRGLEIPFWGNTLHPFDDKWFLNNIKNSWENVITCVPGTMNRLQDDPYFGLASIKSKSRDEAIRFYKKVLGCVKTLKKKFGNRSVIAVQITTSPINELNEKKGMKKMLKESISEILSWDWHGTKILIEHCDAVNKNNIHPKKGFLQIDEEIDVVLQLNSKYDTDFGIMLNWGRSVIEERSVNGIIKHIKKTIENNLLSGLVFSGTTDKNNNLYGAWSDLHMPPPKFKGTKFYEKESLMSYDNIKAALSLCDLGSLDYIGIKLHALPNNSTIEKRVGINSEAMEIIDHAILTI